MAIRKYLRLSSYVYFLVRQCRKYLDYAEDRRMIQTTRKKFRKAGLMDKKNLSPAFLKQTNEYWREHFGRSIDLTWHIAFSNHSGNEDFRYIPANIWFSRVLPHFNQLLLRPAYLDKNLSDVLLDIRMKTPEVIIRRIHGRYYLADYNVISRSEAEKRISRIDGDMIIKGSQTDNGIGIRRLSTAGDHLYINERKVDFSTVESIYGRDFIIQKRIRQHPVMAEPHPDSVNTIRVVTFRWHDEINVLFASCRFGADGKITDNGATGGAACGIDETGRMFPFCIDHQLRKQISHPTTGYSFQQQAAVPAYQRICEHVIALHKQILHFDIVSWDVAVDEEANPIFIEVNYRGDSARSQLLMGKPLFGELTKDVLNQIRDSNMTKGRLL